MLHVALAAAFAGGLAAALAVALVAGLCWHKIRTYRQSTQQAEQAGFTREEITRRASQFSLKINKRQK
jgi:hypothetical protein